MPDVTVKFADGSSHLYEGAPDSITDLQVAMRARDDFPQQTIASISGAKQAGLGERLKAFATEGQVGKHGVFTSDLPQLLYGIAGGPIEAITGAKTPQPQTIGEKESRRAGEELPLALGRAVPTKVGLTSFLNPPNFRGASWLAGAQKAAAARQAVAAAATQAAKQGATAKSILSSPVVRAIAHVAGYGTVAEMIRALHKYLPNVP